MGLGNSHWHGHWHVIITSIDGKGIPSDPKTGQRQDTPTHRRKEKVFYHFQAGADSPQGTGVNSRY
jgi:hypothetical protein